MRKIYREQKECLAEIQTTYRKVARLTEETKEILNLPGTTVTTTSDEYSSDNYKEIGSEEEEQRHTVPKKGTGTGKEDTKNPPEAHKDTKVTQGKKERTRGYWVSNNTSDGFMAYRQNHAVEAGTTANIDAIPMEFKSTNGNMEEAITHSMIRLLRHGAPVTSYTSW